MGVSCIIQIFQKKRVLHLTPLKKIKPRVRINFWDIMLYLNLSISAAKRRQNALVNLLDTNFYQEVVVAYSTLWISTPNYISFNVKNAQFFFVIIFLHLNCYLSWRNGLDVCVILHQRSHHRPEWQHRFQMYLLLITRLLLQTKHTIIRKLNVCKNLSGFTLIVCGGSST